MAIFLYFNFFQTMLAMYGLLSENIFSKQSFIKKTAISNHFVSLWKVCYWKENISKQIEILCLQQFSCQYPLTNYPDVEPSGLVLLVSDWVTAFDIRTWARACVFNAVIFDLFSYLHFKLQFSILGWLVIIYKII